MVTVEPRHALNESEPRHPSNCPMQLPSPPTTATQVVDERATERRYAIVKSREKRDEKGQRSSSKVPHQAQRTLSQY